MRLRQPTIYRSDETAYPSMAREMTMAEFRDQKAATSAMVDLDDEELLGFDCLGPDDEAQTKQAIGIALNKRGLEGPIIK